MPHTVTVCALFYGEHLALAQRCIDSICRTWHPVIAEVRVGFNGVGPATRQHVLAQLKTLPCPAKVYDPGRNALKYPLMRRMFHDPCPLTSAWTMWFDDDSALHPQATADWWPRTLQAAADQDMLGELWTKALEGRQLQALRAQPWHTGRTGAGVAHAYPRITFATGGWWLLRTALLQRWDWPLPELRHNGGDVLLGALMREQGYRLKHYNCQLLINADLQKQTSSSARRRGVSQRPLWYDFQPDAPADLSHQQFACPVLDPKAL